ncbi:SAM-dependent methyltransferase [Streptomyces californicus]|uniref:SAM-dependent methyltransferase n=1 Tax=Streptomyces californicus TaxID=67351 RepID=UPI00296FFB12|nr:SAM-dependent methyltransferase [Streptomyces californicus]MDW4916288.1 SAM-dependent methyltransferase [Streptomyces californicus]
MTSTSLVATGLPGRPEPAGPPAHVARVWDHLTNGSDNYATDRDLADRLTAVAPWLRSSVLAHRRHTTRAVKFLATEGFAQYLDLGCGLPYEERNEEMLHPHDAARTIRDDVRTMYVDEFGAARVGADTILERENRTLAVQADARSIPELLARAREKKFFDLQRPIAALAHSLPEWMDDHDALDFLNDLHRYLPPGSALSLTHAGTGTEHEDAVLAQRSLYAAAGINFFPRSHGHVRALLGRWVVQTPGVVRTELWGTGYGPFAQRVPRKARDVTGSYAAIALSTAP